jgi:hypothetical protein
VHEQLKQDEERQLVLARLERINGLRGVDAKGKGGSGGGHGAGGLKNTWKKLKGKKKKQRNLTAPEISSEEFKAINEEKKKKSGTLESVNEERRAADREKEKNKHSTDKEMTRELKKTTTVDIKASPKRPVSTSADSHRVDTPSSVEDSPLSQKSEPRLSQPDHSSHPRKLRLSSYSGDHEGESKLLSPKSGDIVLVEDLSQISAGKLSQVSGGKLSLSQSGTFTGPDEPSSTQSSIRSGGDHLIHHESGFIPNGVHGSDHDHHDLSTSRLSGFEHDSLPMDGDSVSQLHFGSFRRGCTRMYLDYGNKDHKLNLERVEEFLKSSMEMEPVDLNILRDWDGWVMASKDINV